MTDKAWIESVDGEPVLVHGSGDWSDETRAAFVAVVRAAKRKYFSTTNAGPIDPDCKVGKHAACPGWTWDEGTDSEARCGCSCHEEES